MSDGCTSFTKVRYLICSIANKTVRSPQNLVYKGPVVTVEEPSLAWFCNYSYYLTVSLKNPCIVLTTQLPLPSTTEEFYNSSSNLTLYCDDIQGTVPSLRQFSILIITNTLLRHQVIQDHLF